MARITSKTSPTKKKKKKLVTPIEATKRVVSKAAEASLRRATEQGSQRVAALITFSKSH